jgi:hypothetical protein
MYFLTSMIFFIILIDILIINFIMSLYNFFIITIILIFNLIQLFN